MPSAQAADIRVLQVSYADGLHIELRALVKAPVQRVARLLSDDQALVRLVPIIVAAQRMSGAAPGAQRVRIQMQGCVLFVCATLVDVVDVTRLTQDAYRAVTVPALSDFSAGEMSWSYTAVGHDTLLRLRAWLKPSLWLPPLLGPYLVERKARGQVIQGVRHLEALARVRRPLAKAADKASSLSGAGR